MSSNESKAYQFTITNGKVSAIYELKNGRPRMKSIDHDETYSIEGATIVKREFDDGRIEKTVYADDNGDGFYLKVSESYEVSGVNIAEVPHVSSAQSSQVSSPSSVTASGTSGYRFEITGDQVSAVYEIERGLSKQERITSNESWTVQANQVIKTEYEHGVVETSVYADSDGDGLFQKVSKSYGVSDGSSIRWLTSSQHGEDGDDQWRGSLVDDDFHGGAGQDRLSGGDGGDDLYGGEGDDSLYGDRGTDHLEGGAGNDRLSGGLDADDLYGGDGFDSIDGGAGDDHLIGDSDSQSDLYAGGSGNDSLDLSNALAPVYVNLATGNLQQLIDGLTVTDRIVSIEAVIGSDYADHLTGNSLSDKLDGGLGDDVLEGGRSRDTLSGGEGNDVFLYRSISDSGITLLTRDTITDFSRGDRIDLSGIDARSGNNTNDAFQFIGSSKNLTLSNANGALWFEQGILYGSTDADLAPEFSIELIGVTSFELTDFVG
jgi:Ca2+-binding RTX toxin-like protein